MPINKKLDESAIHELKYVYAIESVCNVGHDKRGEGERLISLITSSDGS
jgi:Ni,Fe-hydrogenase III large subunit